MKKLRSGLDPMIGQRTRFRKGESGNPGGRPKRGISESTRAWLSQIDAKSGKSNAELVAAAQGKRALQGDTQAYCAIRDTSEGRPAQMQQHELVAHSPLKVEVKADLMGAIRDIYGLGSMAHPETEATAVLPAEGNA